MEVRGNGPQWQRRTPPTDRGSVTAFISIFRKRTVATQGDFANCQGHSHTARWRSRKPNTGCPLGSPSWAAMSVPAEVRRPPESASLSWEILQSFSNSSRLWLKHPNDCVIAFHSLPFPTKAEMERNIENLQSTDSQQPVPFLFRR